LLNHSKGALAIENALRSLPPERHGIFRSPPSGRHRRRAEAEELKHCGYAQFLGMLDGLGVNSWGHQPEQRPLAHHSTNAFIAFSLLVAMLL
jgi:hypothetical protein